ncbi:U32 family peptidase [uncultured Parolsenella sp.]|uniref:U32 family peptidase n=1 Tax=uncultured Parolsenella sp. TaxID=2083008 RepID=UPI0027D95009|nr:U32 family peptidase [uncultured Parolsenella sp.]
MPISAVHVSSPSRAGKPPANTPELLAPARDREAFLAAVAAGADAIYCGVAGGLNARRKAPGIPEGQLSALCHLAHDHGARVYVTANIVVKQEELASAVGAAWRYLAAGADALIIQDLGFLAEVRHACPTAEIHVSTQANVHDARGVALCRELGASRVTLSRELPLTEIAAIAAEEHAAAARLGAAPCELEVFAHGAICPSYSGLCMLSSFLREGRSPNRGLCAQPCRLPFDLVGEEGVHLQPAERERPLCTHDNCAIGDARALAAAGVASLKLEGRMKPAAYVHTVTSAWRSVLDGACVEDVSRGLKRSFNRGLTDAYLHGASGNELMSYERSGNRGELVGEVVGFEPEPGFVPRDGQQLRGTALVRLVAPVGAGDAVELRHPEEPTRFLVVEAPCTVAAGETLRLAVPRPMREGSDARVTRSVVLERAAQAAVVEMEGELEAIEAAGTSRGDGKSLPCMTAQPGPAATSALTRPLAPEPCALVGRVEDATGLRLAGARRVYLDVASGARNEMSQAAACAAGLIPVLDEVCRECDHARNDRWIRGGEPVAAANLAELALARTKGAVPEVTADVPVHNAATLGLLARLGVRAAWLSPELSIKEACALATLNRALESPLDLGIVIFGRPRLMTLEHCVLQVAYDCDRNHASCPYRKLRHWLVNIDGRHLPVDTDARGRSRVYLDEPVDLLGYVPELVRAGVSRLIVDARHVSEGEALHAMASVCDVLGGTSGSVDAAVDARRRHDGCTGLADKGVM